MTVDCHGPSEQNAGPRNDGERFKLEWIDILQIRTWRQYPRLRPAFVKKDYGG